MVCGVSVCVFVLCVLPLCALRCELVLFGLVWVWLSGVCGCVFVISLPCVGWYGCCFVFVVVCVFGLVWFVLLS